MRLLYAPLNEPGSEQIGLERAFQKAFKDVLIFDYRALGRGGFSHQRITEEFVFKAMVFRPDVIHLQVQDSGQILPHAIEAIRRQVPGVKVTHWNGDVRTDVSVYQRAICRACDLTLIPSVGQIPLFEATGSRRVHYWQVGIDPELDVPTPGAIEAWRRNHGVEKIVFLANHYAGRFPGSAHRWKLAEAMKDAFRDDFGIYGTNWPPEWKPRQVRYREQGLVSGGAMVTLGMNHFRGIERYYSDRTALAIASGSCHLLDHVPGIEEEYTPGEQLVTFQTIEEAVEKAQKLIADPGGTTVIGVEGKARALEAHTWDHRVQQYRGYLEEL